MRDSRAHVEASGGRPQGRLQAAVRHRRRGRVKGLSRQQLTRLVRRYRDGGLDALEPHSRRPLTNPGRTPDAIRARIVALRTELTARVLTRGRSSIAWHLGREGQPVPSTSTIRRVLHAAGLVTPEPRKRPRSSWHRFEAAAPNECWQSDFTHWRLADGSEVEDPELARRPFALPARLHSLPAGRW